MSDPPEFPSGGGSTGLAATGATGVGVGEGHVGTGKETLLASRADAIAVDPHPLPALLTCWAV